MSLDALLALIEQDTDAEAAALLADGERRAELILAAARERVAARREAERARLDAAGRHEVACAEAQEVRTHREAWLREREAVLDRIFAQARRILDGVGVERYSGSLAASVDRALRYLEGKPAILRCRPDAEALVAVRAAGGSEVRVVADAAAPAGLVAEAADGSVVVDATLASRLDARRPFLAIALAGQLEGADP